MERELDRMFLGKRRSVWDEEEKDEGRSKINRWEITPRTATQSKRLKWDQTPLGYIRMEDDGIRGNRMREAGGGWDEDEGDERVRVLYSEMSAREINMCLPSKGYRRYDVVSAQEDLSRVDMRDLPEIQDGEKDFFMPIFHSRNETEAAIYKGLLLVKNGDRRMSRHGRSMLTRGGADVNVVLEKVILMAMSLELSVEEKTKTIEMIKMLVGDANAEKIVYVREILIVLSSYAYVYSLRRSALGALSVVYRNGLDFVVSRIRGDFSSREPYMRDVVGKIVGTLVGYFGMRRMGEVLKSLGTSGRDETRKTFIRSVVWICSLGGGALAADIKPVLDVLCGMITDRNRFIRVDTANAVSSVFGLIRPLRYPGTDEVFLLLRKEVSKSRSIEFHAFLRTMSHLCQGNKEFCRITFDVLRGSEGRGVAEAKVFERICDHIDAGESQNYFGSILDALFLDTSKERDGVIEGVCVKMARYREMSKMILRHYNNPLRTSLVSRVFSRVPELDLDEEDVEIYYNGIREALGHDDTTVQHLDLLVNKRFCEPRYISGIVEDSMKFIKSPDQSVRIKGFRIISKVAGVAGMKTLGYYGNILFENINDEDQVVLGFVLEAMYSVYNSYRFKPAFELIPSILPILRSRDAKVVEGGILLLHTVCVNSLDECERIGPREWIRISYELVDSLTSWNRKTRRRAIESLGLISRMVGPQEVLNILIDNLESPDKHQRLGASLGIAVVGEYNELFSILPTLLSDYSVPNVLVQQGILRAMGHIFQRTSPVSSEYIYSVLPVVEDAMMDEDPGYRNLGLVLVKHMVLGYRVPRVDQELVVHLLNLVWPNILDFTPTIRHSFDECVESFATVLSSQMLYKYVLRGLFHPARAVRERYNDVFEIMKHYDSTSLSQCFLVEEGFLGM